MRLDTPEEDDPVVHIVLWVQTRPQLDVSLTAQPVAAGLDGAVLSSFLTVRTGLAGVQSTHVGSVVQHASLQFAFNHITDERYCQEWPYFGRHNYIQVSKDVKSEVRNYKTNSKSLAEKKKNQGAE